MPTGQYPRERGLMTHKDDKPEPLPCTQCGKPGVVRWVAHPKSSKPQRPGWCRGSLCRSCQRLRYVHGLTKAEHDALLAQGCSIAGCTRPATHIDHDHSICPARNHSCDKCRRGPLCRFHNMTILPIVEAFIHGDLPEVADYLGKHGIS